MVTKKLSHYDLMRLWKNGFDAKRGYFVGKPDETALDCAQEMGLQDIETINIVGSVVGKDKKGKQIVITYIQAPYAVDITNEIRWSDDF
jgi:hypothetical protein